MTFLIKFTIITYLYSFTTETKIKKVPGKLTTAIYDKKIPTCPSTNTYALLVILLLLLFFTSIIIFIPKVYIINKYSMVKFIFYFLKATCFAKWQFLCVHLTLHKTRTEVFIVVFIKIIFY